MLPFQNMSGDPEQDYFADGIVEDITTRLSRIKWMFVIARNSAFTYKGRAVDVRQVGRELGVRYVVEGSVRKAGTRMRITGQLIQAETGQHIWADIFDGELADVFELQDQVTASLVAAVEPSLRQAEIERARSKPTGPLDAYDHYLRALPHFYTLSQSGMSRAIALLEQAIAIDPNFALGKAFVARCYAWRNPQGWAQAPEQERETAIRLGREALEEGADDPSVLWMVGFVKWQLRVDLEGALELYDKSLAINPNCAQALTVRGWAHAWAGRSDEAIPSLLQALRLSPLDPEAFFAKSALGCAYMLTGGFEEGLKWTTRALRERPGFAPALRFHAVCLAQLGRSREARETVDHLLQLEPEPRPRYPRASVHPSSMRSSCPSISTASARRECPARACFGEVDPAHRLKCGKAKKRADSTQVDAALGDRAPRVRSCGRHLVACGAPDRLHLPAIAANARGRSGCFPSLRAPGRSPARPRRSWLR